MARDKQYYVSRMSKLGKIMYYTKAARFWADGDSASFLWNYWNPISWPIIIFLCVLQIAVCGLKGFIEYAPELGLVMSKYWKEHKSEREFL